MYKLKGSAGGARRDRGPAEAAVREGGVRLELGLELRWGRLIGIIRPLSVLCRIINLCVKLLYVRECWGILAHKFFNIK